MIHRLMHHRDQIEKLGHHVKFAVSRGPLNIASFLMGATELMTALLTDREKVVQLLDLITDFILDWLKFQKEMIDSIDGIMILDDLVGFIGDQDFRDLAQSRIKELFAAFPSQVNIFHNDAPGLVCAPYLKDMGVHVFNFSFEHSLPEMRQAAGDAIILMGNIPPRDVMARGSVKDVHASLSHAIHSATDPRQILWSVGGGMPQGVSSENIRAFIKALNGN
jgi:uroporphyrinogen decarboxylase